MTTPSWWGDAPDRTKAMVTEVLRSNRQARPLMGKRCLTKSRADMASDNLCYRIALNDIRLSQSNQLPMTGY